MLKTAGEESNLSRRFFASTLFRKREGASGVRIFRDGKPHQRKFLLPTELPEVGKSLLLRQVDKARFLHVLSPLEYGQVQVSLVLVPLAEGGYRADATVAAGAVTFAQLRLTLE